MAFIDRILSGNKNVFDQFHINELKVEKEKIKTDLDIIKRNSSKLDKEINSKIQSAVGKSKIDKQIAFREIKSIEQKKKQFETDADTYFKKFDLISAMIYIKERESKLKDKGVWQKISEMDPESIVNQISRIKVKDNNFDVKVETWLNGVESGKRGLLTDTDDDEEFIEFEKILESLNSGNIDLDLAKSEISELCFEKL